jgi:hypothetical protein
MVDAAQAAGQAPKDGAEKEKSGSRQCMDDTMDVVAILGRSLKASAESSWWAFQRMVYPVKESVFSCADYTQEYIHPTMANQPPQRGVPVFHFRDPFA